MAPEQFRPEHTVSPATDLYALGMVAYTLVVGKAYWVEEAKSCAGNVFAFAIAASQGPRERATARAQRAGVSLPAAFDAWFATAVAPSPQARFLNATALVSALAEALGVQRPALEGSAPQGTVTPPPRAKAFSTPDVTTPGMGATKPPSHRRRRGLLIAVVASLGVAALGGVALLGRRVAIDGHVDAPPLPTAAAGESGGPVPATRTAPTLAPAANETASPPVSFPAEAAPSSSVASPAPQRSAPEPSASERAPAPAAPAAKAAPSVAVPSVAAPRSASSASARTRQKGPTHARD